jgi:hypothetical protein
MAARGLPEVDELHATSGRDGPLPQRLARRTGPDGRSRKSRLYARAHRCEAGKQVKEPCAACGPMQPLWHGWGAVGQQAIQGLSRVAVNASGVGEGDWVALQAAVRVAGLAEVPTRRDVAATRRRESTPSWTQPCLARSFESGHKPQLARREIADGSCILPS